MTEFVEVDCLECGEPVEMVKPTHVDCLNVKIEEPKPEDLERAIPESDLRELVEEWRTSATDMDYAGQTDYGRGRVKAFRDCADELEQVLEE